VGTHQPLLSKARCLPLGIVMSYLGLHGFSPTAPPLGLGASLSPPSRHGSWLPCIQVRFTVRPEGSPGTLWSVFSDMRVPSAVGGHVRAYEYHAPRAHTLDTRRLGSLWAWGIRTAGTQSGKDDQRILMRCDQGRARQQPISVDIYTRAFYEQSSIALNRMN
jgi:hypothetical protein